MPPLRLTNNATRKPHYKSRKGCFNCKRRHVKCNEARPRCSHCSRLGIECTWPENQYSGSSSTSSPNQIQHQSPAASHPRPGHALPPDLAIDDLRLLHFWIVNTAASLTDQSGAAHLWQNVIVELGFQHHFLLRGILAVAAIHKATIFLAERDNLILQSSSHIGVAITSFRNLLVTPLPATCVPVFVMAGLLSIHSLGLAQLRPPVDAVADIHTWMRLVKGTQSTIRQNWERLQASEIAPLLALRHRCETVEDGWEELDSLKELVQNDAQSTDSVRRIYFDTIHQLQIVYECRESLANDDIRASSTLSSWVALIPPEYHDLLASREPVALVLIAYFGVLMGIQGRAWWFRNWSTWILESVRAQLPTAYERWLDWPTAQIEGG